jgi:FkbM family methyltransferase
MIKTLLKYLHLRQNIKNWKEYTFNKSERNIRKLQFVTKPTSIQFLIDDNSYPIFKEIFVEDFYNITEVLKNVPQKPLIIDIGANIGLFEALILSKRPEADILAYEPFEDNVRLLKNMMNNNPSYLNNVKVFQKAVSDKDNEEINLYVKHSEGQSSIASIYEDFDPRNKNMTTVTTTTLEAIVNSNKIDKIDILKMDCEGAEYPILYSTPPSILKRIKLLLIEVHDLDNKDKNYLSLSTFLSSSGFKIKSNKTNNGCYYILASNLG